MDNKGLARREWYEVRRRGIEIGPHTNLCFSLHKPGSKNQLSAGSSISSAGLIRMSSDPFEFGLSGVGRCLE